MLLKQQMRNSSSQISLLAVIISATALSLTFALIFIVFLNRSFFFRKQGSSQSIQELYDKGEPKKAIRELEKSSNIERGSGESLLWEGKLWYLATFKRFEETNWAGYGEDSLDWFKGKDVDNAIHFLNEAIKSPDHKIEANLFLAIIYMEKGWFDKSEHKFKAVLEEDSNNEIAILNYAILKSRDHNYEKSIDILKLGLTINENSTDFLKNLFKIYSYHIENPKLAIEYGNKYLKNASRGDPGILDVRREMIDIISRFPEYNSDSLLIHDKRLKDFTPRKRASPYK